MIRRAKHSNQLPAQNVVACVWDFDKTLIPGYMQTPLFTHYGVNEKLFWSEVNKLPKSMQKEGNLYLLDNLSLTTY